MKTRIEKTRKRGFEQFMIKGGFAYVGKRMNSKHSNYQVGFSIWIFETMYFNTRTKPYISDLWALNLGLMIPYFFFLVARLLMIAALGLALLLIYVLYTGYKHALQDFGCSRRYLIVPILFWQFTAMALALYILLN